MKNIHNHTGTRTHDQQTSSRVLATCLPLCYNTADSFLVYIMYGVPVHCCLWCAAYIVQHYEVFIFKYYLILINWYRIT